MEDLMKLLSVTVTLFTFLFIIQIYGQFQPTSDQMQFLIESRDKDVFGNTGIIGHIGEKRIVKEIEELRQEGLFFLSAIEQNKIKQNQYTTPEHSYDNWKQQAQFAIKIYKQNNSYGVRQAVSELQGTVDLLENVRGK